MRYFFWVLLFYSASLLGRITLHAQSGTWAYRNSTFFDPRADFAAAAINGRIYTMGGQASGSLEVYDPSIEPSNNCWTNPPVTGTFTDRRGLTASVIDGKIYLIGGFATSDASALNTMEVLDPKTLHFSKPSTTGTFTARGGLSSAVVNGKIYVIGGSPSDTANICSVVEVFDPATSTWSTPSTTGSFIPRWYFATAVVGGKIYAIGGMDRTGSAINSVQIYDPATRRWSTPSTSGTFTARSSPAAAVLNDKIYVMGGLTTQSVSTLEVFDPATNNWSTPVLNGSMDKRHGLAAIALNGSIYALGGNITDQLGTWAVTNANQSYIPDSSVTIGTITLGMDTLNLGTLYYGQATVVTIMAYNPSATAVSVDSATIGRPASINYQVLSNNKNTSLPYLLQPGDSIGFLIEYTAPLAEERDSASLNIFFGHSPISIRSLTLIGASQNWGSVTSEVSEIDFGTLNYNEDSTITLSVVNRSSRTALISQLAVTGLDPDYFTVLGNTKQAILPYLLGPNDTIGFLLRYTAPSTAENDSAILHLFYDESSDSVRAISLIGASRQSVTSVATGERGSRIYVSLFPNPAGSKMSVRYSIPNPSEVVLRILDQTGKLIKERSSGHQNVGTFDSVVDLKELPSGSYLLELSACGQNVTRSMKVLK